MVSHLSIFAQGGETDEISKREISKLAFIVGDWEGEGWMMAQNGIQHSFVQFEKIIFKLDSTAILIEGLGMDDEKVIHNALAIITYNKEEKNFNFTSFLANGMGGKFKGELIGEKFYWYPRDNMRYIIYLNEDGQWFETGEMKNGEDWFQFFEMTLDKI